MSVYSWGKNVSGELGVGNNEDQLDPVTIEGIRGNVVGISSGEKHCLAVNELGDVYAWGRGKDGQHGNGRKDAKTSVPVRVRTLESYRIAKVICGSYHCVALNRQGEVFEWGMLHKFMDKKNDFGPEILLPGMEKKEDNITSSWEKKRQEMVERSLRQYYSGKQTAEISDKESVSFNDDVANFGNFVAYLEPNPSRLESLEGVKIIDGAAGYAFTLVISDKGLVYGWGFNEKRQLGLGHRYNQEKPQLIKSLALAGVRIVQVACGQQHSLALTDDGKVYSWGLGVFGQLGHGTIYDIGEPVVIEALLPQKIVQIACGSHHCIALSADGVMFTWGSSEYGQQGGKNQYNDWEAGEQHETGQRRNFFAIPRAMGAEFNGKKIVKIACGNLHNVALSDEGECFTWGWGITGALGHGTRNFLHFPRVVARLRGEKIVNVTATAYATMAVTTTAPSLFALDFRAYVNSPMFSDLTFKIQNKPIHAHKCIVFARCPALKKLTEDPAQKEIVVEGVEFYVFISFLRYIYTDHLKAVSHHVPKLALLAERFEIPRLGSLCKRFLLFNDAPVIGGDLSQIPQEQIPDSCFATELDTAVNISEFSDVKLQLSSESRLSANKMILTSRSDYFRTIFKGDFREKNEEQIDVQEIDPKTLLTLLRFIYSNQISLTSEEIVPVLMAAGRFLLDDLKQIIEKQLEDDLESDNWESAIDFLSLAEAVNAPKLRRACINLLAEKFSEHEVELKKSDIPSSTIKHIEFLHRKRVATL